MESLNGNNPVKSDYIENVKKLETLKQAKAVEAPKQSTAVSEEIATQPIEKTMKLDTNKITEVSDQLSSSVIFDEDLKLMVLEIKDNESGELIKTIPTTEMLEFMRRMSDSNRNNTGNIIDIKA